MRAAVSKTSAPNSRTGKAFAWYAGWPLLDSDVQAIATSAKVTLLEECNFSATAEIVNQGLNLFAIELQPVNTPAEHEAWFVQVAESLSVTLGMFGGDSPSKRRAALRNFETRPMTCKKAGVDILTIDTTLAAIRSLRDAATAAGAFEGGKKMRGRKSGSPRNVLASAMKEAWRSMTGAAHPTCTKPSDGVGPPGGPFIDFVIGSLVQAADRFAQSRRSHTKEAASELRKLASTPHSIAAWAVK
jgi:hypothetical protein